VASRVEAARANSYGATAPYGAIKTIIEEMHLRVPKPSQLFDMKIETSLV
jgi:hypothetical protein